MRINHTNNDVRRLESTKGVQNTPAEPVGKPNAAPAVSPAQRSDKVQISEAGRALAAQASAAPQETGEASLSPERVQEIRNRILQGAYDSLDSVQEVARRMLERGDI